MNGVRNFRDIYEILEDSLNEVIGGSLKIHQHVPNGRISNRFDLLVYLDILRGGSLYNIMCKYGVSRTDIFEVFGLWKQ